MKVLSTFAALGILACVVAAQQDRPGREPARDHEAAGDPDKFFMVKAAMMNLSEVAAGRLAAERSQNAGVKDFGQQMVQDHTKANAELARLAEKKGVRLPARPGEGHDMVAAHLGKLSGADFDQEYMTLMVGEHAKAVALFESKARLAKDPDLKSWAATTLKSLKHHHEMARELYEKVASGARDAR